MDDLPTDWPLREKSRLIRSRPHVWHVQVTGQGPDVLLLHGAAASGHSFHRLVPHLPGYRLIMPDLPGQGYTRAGGHLRLGLDAMADDLVALCADQDWRPMATGPFAAAVVTKLSSSRAQVARLLAGMGSPLDDEGVEMYRRLVSRTSHIAGTLGMMAQWQLEPLLERLPQISVPTLLITAAGDRAVPPRVSAEAAARMPRAQHLALPRWGHLVHEEAPEEVAAQILPFLKSHQGAVSLV